MIKSRFSHTGLRITTILVSMVVGIVAIVLCCLTALFLTQYWNSIMLGARTTSSQAVSQVSSTVANYLADMNQAMDLVEQSMSKEPADQNELLDAFLTFRPDVVAVTSYSSDGTLLQCWSPDRVLREDIVQNLSFNLETAQNSEGSFLSLPHVENIFESYYPWVVTLTAPLPQGEETAWVSLDLSFSSISSHINNVSIGQHGYCFLMDKHGNIGFHPQQQLLYSGLKSEDTAKLAAFSDGTYADDRRIHPGRYPVWIRLLAGVHSHGGFRFRRLRPRLGDGRHRRLCGGRYLLHRRYWQDLRRSCGRVHLHRPHLLPDHPGH